MSIFRFKGGFSSLAVSSRVRLARNLKGYLFQPTDRSVYKEIAEKVFDVLKRNPTLSSEFTLYEVISDSEEADKLVVTHLISPYLAQKGGWVILSNDRGVSIMVGEEDHVRLQVIGSGLCPKECLETANRLICLIESDISFSYQDTLGYLTACPTNLGTGLRTSVMLHLPILTETGKIERMIGYAGSHGCAVRGAYGEGSKAVGGFYQVSNQITLGATDHDLTDTLIETATAILEEEKKGRELLRSHSETLLYDKIFRALGAMQYAYSVQTTEAIECISDVLIGVQMGILSGVRPEALYHLEEEIRPVLLTGSPQDRDAARAKHMRNFAKNITIAI